MEKPRKQETKKSENFRAPTPAEEAEYIQRKSEINDTPVPLEMRRDYEEEKKELEKLMAIYKTGSFLGTIT